MQHVLASKWRPKQFDQVIGQDPVVQALSNALTKKHLHHAYLFTGTRGVGKTTLARILSKCLNCESDITSTPCEQCLACQEINTGRFPDLYEIDAASRTKVEDTREILDNVQYTPTRGRFKIYLIDEVHMLSGHSFNALLKTLEEPPDHVKFLLATTDPQKLPATVLSRCLQFHLRPMSSQNIATHLQTVLEQESIPFEQPALKLISQAAHGSMRDALSLLDQGIAFGNATVHTNDIKTMLGAVDTEMVQQLLITLANGDIDAMLNISQIIDVQGIDYAKVVSSLLEQLHRITLLQLSTTRKTAQEPGSLADLAQQLSSEQVQLYYDIGMLGQKNASLAPTPRIGFEMTLLRMLAFTPYQERRPRENNVKPATQNEKPAKQQAATQKPTTQPRNGEQWLDLLNQLNLPGATNALAHACSLQKIENNTWHLCLNSSHKALLNDRHIERINNAIGHALGVSVQVHITVQDTQLESAAAIKKNREQKKLGETEALILKDKNVQKIMSEFDASIIKDSITIENNQ